MSIQTSTPTVAAFKFRFTSLSTLASSLPAGGVLYLKEPILPASPRSVVNVPITRSAQDLVRELKLVGFVDLEVRGASTAGEEDLTEIVGQVWGITDEAEKWELVRSLRDQVHIVEVVAKKPAYEVGASFALPFAKKVGNGTNGVLNKAAIWTLSADDDDDGYEELENEDELLDEQDLLKPDKATLSRPDCKTDGKRKACKNCSCGLAEELEEEKKLKPPPQPATSSCGSCYLGDAFRCMTCPYLGMPSFNPGEKVVLAGNLMQDDI